jgi:hypothetical protein
VARHDDLRLQGQQAAERGDPVAAVGLADERDRPRNTRSPANSTPPFGTCTTRSSGVCGRADMLQRKVHRRPGDQGGRAVEPAVGRDQPRALVDPGNSSSRLAFSRNRAVSEFR